MAGLVITFVTTAFVRDWEVRERRILIAQTSAEHVEALNGQLIRSMEVLYAIESLFNAGKEISRREFRDFVANTLRRLGDCRVSRGIRGCRQPPAPMGSPGARGRLRRVSVRRAAGRRAARPGRRASENISPSSSWRTCRETSRRSGSTCGRKRSAGRRWSARATPASRPRQPPIRLVQEPGSQLGFLVLLPVYERTGIVARGAAVATCEGLPSRSTGSEISWTRRCERR